MYICLDERMAIWQVQHNERYVHVKLSNHIEVQKTVK